jgi:hypothetical protein
MRKSEEVERKEILVDVEEAVDYHGIQFHGHIGMTK